MAPVDPGEQVTELRGGDCHRTVGRARPQEAAPLQPLGVNAASNFPKCAEVKFLSWRDAVISRRVGDRGLLSWVADRGGAAAVPGLVS